MWKTLCDRLLSGLVVSGTLGVTFPDGETKRYGNGTPPEHGLTFHGDTILRRIVLNPELALGEGYMRGQITVEGDRLEDLLAFLIRNRRMGHMPVWVRTLNGALYHTRRVLQRNAPQTARRNVAHHYDLSDDLYRLFLDEDMQYSCAYFDRDDATLEEAQRAKKRHIARKLLLAPGLHVLDIGCGWGGMALTLARDYGVRVTGVTLSRNQYETARQRAADAGLADRVTFLLKDYRHVDGPFDRVVSVGMFEHVGVPNYATYFKRIEKVLSPDGIAVVHTIGRSDVPQAHSPWIHKYIFPGGYVPSLSEVAPAIEASGLWQADIEIWRLHYAKTLRAWRDRFEAAEQTLMAKYDAAFVRMFRYYLTACILSFEVQRQAVYQFQLAKTRDAVPITRDYLYDRSTAARHAAE